jgi:hypothetical protein
MGRTAAASRSGIRRLAVQPEEIANGAPALTIFDRRTSRVRAKLGTLDIAPSQVQGQPFSTAWSPGGRHLVVVPGLPPIVLLLGPRNLGR